MFSTPRKVLSLLGVAAAIAAGMSLGGGTAMAADPPKCTATLKPGWGCLAVENKTGNMRSLRTEKSGSCIPDLAGKKRYATRYAIAGKDAGPKSIDWIFYTGSNCEGNTVTGNVALTGWSGVDKHNYVTITVSTS